MIGNVIAGLMAGGAAAGDFESIATQTVTSNVSSVTFSSIPSDYTHLQIRAIAITSAPNNNTRLRFNSDSGSNYSVGEFQGSGTAPTSFGSTPTGIYPSFSPGSTYPGVLIIDILDYKNTNKYKTTRSLWGYDTNGGGYVGIASGSWRNTAAITSIVIDCTGASQTINTNSHFALYGIKG